MPIKKVNLSEKLSLFADHWSPKIVGELNGQMVKLAKLKGEFVMHHHEQEDELFLVISGVLYIEMEDQTLELHPGEFVIIPKGTPHRPDAPEEVSVMLFEPATTLNTGDADSDLKVEKLQKI